jgi:hypothetical protein
MADPTQIITPSQFKSYSGISDTNSDTIISVYCDAVTDLINNYCNRNFLHQTYTVSLDGNDEVYLRNLERPITAVTSITIDDTALNLVTEAADDNYFLYADQGKIYYGSGFTSGNQNVVIVYKAGYTEATMPADVVQAAYLLISMVWEKQGKTTALSESTPAGYSKSFLELTIPQLIKDILGRYTLMMKPNLNQSFFIEVI